MKRILIIIAASICLCLSANAQVFFGGKITKYKSGNIKYYSFSPSIGYQYNRLAFGFGFGHQKASYLFNGVYTTDRDSAFDLFPFMRYHIYDKDKLAFFLEAAFVYSIHKREHYHAIYCSPGLLYRFTPHCAATATLGLIGYSDSYWYGFKDFKCSFGLSTTTLSFYYYFGK